MAQSSEVPLKLYFVQIHGNGAFLKEEHVMATTAKEALQAVIESIPEEDKAWQSPGWQVQVFPARRAVIL